MIDLGDGWTIAIIEGHSHLNHHCKGDLGITTAVCGNRALFCEVCGIYAPDHVATPYRLLENACLYD